MFYNNRQSSRLISEYSQGLTKNLNHIFLSKKEGENNNKVLITLEDFLDMNNNFDWKTIPYRFNKIDKKLEEHDEKFNQLLNHLNKFSNRLEGLLAQNLNITDVLKRFEARLGSIERKLDKTIL